MGGPGSGRKKREESYEERYLKTSPHTAIGELEDILERTRFSDEWFAKGARPVFPWGPPDSPRRGGGSVQREQRKFPLTVTLHRHQIDWLDDMADKSGMSPAQVIGRLVDAMVASQRDGEQEGERDGGRERTEEGRGRKTLTQSIREEYGLDGFSGRGERVHRTARGEEEGGEESEESERPARRSRRGEKR